MKKNLLLLLIIFIMLPFAIKKEEVKNNKTTQVNIITNNKTEKIDLENYIIGVVAGEMPASFNIEALKAQAVASRSYAMYKYKNNKTLNTNTSDQVYITKKDMKTKWNKEFDHYYNKIKKAVKETKDEVLTYNNEIILAYYFSMSNGNTQESKYVFEEKDYLKKVESIYDNDDLKNYKTNFTFSISDFKHILGLTCENITVNNIIYNESKYVNKIIICDKELKGSDFRSLLGLKSTSFQIDVNENVNITTYGYGHGVGMSQYGANGYANHGLTYKQILKHYYKNVEIKKLNV